MLGLGKIWNLLSLRSFYSRLLLLSREQRLQNFGKCPNCITSVTSKIPLTNLSNNGGVSAAS